MKSIRALTAALALALAGCAAEAPPGPTQGELDAWVTGIYQDSLMATGVSSWGERCSAQIRVNTDPDYPDRTPTPKWACDNPVLTTTAVGELDVRLDTLDQHTADTAAKSIMSLTGASRDDLQVVRVYGSDGRLMSELHREDVLALNL